MKTSKKKKISGKRKAWQQYLLNSIAGVSNSLGAQGRTWTTKLLTGWIQPRAEAAATAAAVMAGPVVACGPAAVRGLKACHHWWPQPAGPESPAFCRGHSTELSVAWQIQIWLMEHLSVTTGIIVTTHTYTAVIQCCPNKSILEGCFWKLNIPC